MRLSSRAVAIGVFDLVNPLGEKREILDVVRSIVVVILYAFFIRLGVLAGEVFVEVGALVLDGLETDVVRDQSRLARMSRSLALRRCVWVT